MSPARSILHVSGISIAISATAPATPFSRRSQSRAMLAFSSHSTPI
jgi:hypothetical protein